MKKALSALLFMAAACFVCTLEAATTFEAYSLFDWFAVSFEGCEEGTALAPSTGVKFGGAWAPLPSGVISTVAKDSSNVKYLATEVNASTLTGPEFVASLSAATNLFDGCIVDMGAIFSPVYGLPEVGEDVRSAFCLLADEDDNLSFHGYTRNGWTRLYSADLEPTVGKKLFQRALFRRINGTMYVTYMLKEEGAADYTELVDQEGNAKFKCAVSGALTFVDVHGNSGLYSLSSSNLVSTASVRDVIPTGYPATFGDWFSVAMREATIGSTLKTDTGVRFGGQWNSASMSGFTATVAEADGEKYLNVEMVDADTSAGPRFDADNGSGSEYAMVEWSMYYTRGESVLGIDLPVDTKSAITIATLDGEEAFCGYVREGWVELRAEGVTPEYDEWYNLLAVFEDSGSSLFVTYYIRTDAGYVRLCDGEGESRFAAAGSVRSVKTVDFRGTFGLRFVNGLQVSADTSLVYFWVGAGADNRWNTIGNWSKTRGGTPCAEIPTAANTAIFPDDATVALENASGDFVSNMVVNATVTLSGTKGLSFSAISGVGTLCLSGTTIRATAPKGSVACRLKIVDETNNELTVADNCDATHSAALLGGGLLRCTNGKTGGGVTFTGDGSEFSGVCQIVSSNTSPTFGATSVAIGPESAWELYVEGSRPITKVTIETPTPNSRYFFFRESEKEWTFGALSGWILSHHSEPQSSNLWKAEVKNQNLIIGGRNEDGWLKGWWAAAEGLVSHGCGLTWTAKSATMDYAVKETAFIRLTGGGTVVLSDEKAAPTDSLTFTDNGGVIRLAPGVAPDLSPVLVDSTAAMVIDDGGEDHVWNTALSASNVRGFTKRGNGSLYLTNAAPQYAGNTRVEAGELVLPFGTRLQNLFIADGAKIVVDLSKATPNALVFSCTACNRALSVEGNEWFEFVNVPPDYPITALGIAGGGVVFVNGSENYVWKGSAGNRRWDDLNNWMVDGAPATRLPSEVSNVNFQDSNGDFILSGDVSVLSVSANSNFLFSANHDLTTTFGFTINGKLTITGTGTLDLGLPVSGVSVLEMIPTNATKAIVAAHPNYTGRVKVASDLGLAALLGAGTIESSVTQTVDVAANETTTFFGTMSGEMTLVKNGNGTLELQGPNEFTGGFALEAGMVRLSAYNAVPITKIDFDAQNRSAWKVEDAEVTRIHTAPGACVQEEYNNSGYNSYGSVSLAVVTDGDLFGKLPYLLMANGVDYSFNNAISPQGYGNAAAWSVVYRRNGRVRSSQKLLSQARGDGGVTLGMDNMWSLRANGVDENEMIYVNGMHERTHTIGTRSVVTALSDLGGSEASWNAIGQTYEGAVAEFIGFREMPSIEQVRATTLKLMQKWGCDAAATLQPLPLGASLTMKTGTVLDLGGFSQTVASFSGAGSVTNGALYTVCGLISQSGGSLTVPANAETIYEIDVRRAELKLEGASGKTIRIRVPDNCTSGQVFCEGTPEWYCDNPEIRIEGPEDGWYTILNMGGGSSVIVR